MTTVPCSNTFVVFGVVEDVMWWGGGGGGGRREKITVADIDARDQKNLMADGL